MTHDEPLPVLADAVEAVVREVPGVAALYPTGSAVMKLLDGAARAMGLIDETSPIGIDLDDSVLQVRISVGILRECGTLRTTRAVHDAVHDLLVARGVTAPRIEVTVARISDPPVVIGAESSDQDVASRATVALDS